jgi:L-asparagine transporter-like permease
MESPIIALLLGSLFSFMLNIIAYYSDELTINLTDITSLASYFIYISAFYSYYLFKTKYSTLNRSFVSPLGNVGALIGTVIFLASIVSVVGFQGSNRIPIICCVGFFVVISVYYFAFMAKKVQFSEEEKDQMFKAYLINGKFLFSIMRNSILLFYLSSFYR